MRTVFQEVEARPRAERSALLAATDPAIRAEVESLLAAHDDPTPFMEQSVWQIIEEQELGRLTGTMIGPYRIVAPIGSGGMGTVFLAQRQDDEFTHRVAVKLIRGGELLVQRFRRERQILASLDHPNIARLFDGGTTPGGLPYLVMEYVDGVPIDEYCRTHALTLPRRLRLFLQLCDAVQYAHRSLIIHRDIKPQNVLVTGDGTVKLLDFGIARLASGDRGRDETVTRIMTPQYASPEQLEGRAVTTASDVYSLGVLLFELLTGRHPFDGKTRTASSEPPPPSRASGTRALKGDLDGITLTALESDPSRRYGSVEAMAEDIRRHLTGHPVAARSATFLYRTGKFVRRNIIAVAAAIAILAVIGAAFAVTLHQKRIAERRFEQVRSLAGSVVFELHDAIAPLAGSTAARELLVRRALVYLDSLSAEASDNTPLRVELAAAYLKIGDVQGLPYSPNLGNTAGALASYRKALAIAQSAADAAPGDARIHTLVADAHDRLGLVHQRELKWIDAFRHHRRALRLRETLPASPRRDLALARTWTAIGDALYIGARDIPGPEKFSTPVAAYESALRVLRGVVLTREVEREVLQETARANQRLGGYFSGPNKDVARALAHHDAALQALESRVRLDPADVVTRRNYADQFVMKATAQNAAADGAGAAESTRRALEMLEPLARQDPSNIEAQHDLAFAHTHRGIALSHLGRLKEAQTSLLEAAAIYERLIAADPHNQEIRRDLGGVRHRLSTLGS